MRAAIDYLRDQPVFIARFGGEITEEMIGRYYPRNLKNKIGLERKIARANWGVTLLEKRLLMLAISKINYSSDNARMHWDGVELDYGQVVVTADDYANLSRCSRQDAPRDLNRAAEKLSEKSLTIIQSERRYKTINFTANVEYRGDQSLVVIQFNPEFFDLIRLLIIGDYVSYTLEDGRGLSLSAWRLFELLLSYPPANAKISVRDLQFALQQKKQPQRTADFLRRILRPAIEQLREVLGWDLTGEPVCRGRRITEYKFSRAGGRGRSRK